MSEPTEQEWADATWARDGHVNPRHKAWVNRLIERTKAAAREEALREAAIALKAAYESSARWDYDREAITIDWNDVEDAFNAAGLDLDAIRYLMGPTP